MRFLFLLAAAGLAASPALAHGQSAPRGRDRDSAYQQVQQGRVLSLPEIRARIRIPGAEYIGAEMLAPGVYRLKFMRGTDVIWIDVEARTGRVLNRQ
ncbi:MAG TPA: hypothetical protein VJS15_06040 [Allosphingosinicella sp.]|nr:hypothetical protein [Allosphingosinicella sp.]